MDSLSGISAIAADVTAVVAGVLLSASFAIRRDALGRANDAASALMTILLVPPALAVAGADRLGPRSGGVSKAEPIRPPLAPRLREPARSG
jgi:hypothetical protein